LDDLIKGCAANERLSQEKLYRLFYPGLILLCKRFFANDHEAIEVLNNGMMKVYRNINAFDGSKGTLFNWAYTIVRHAALDQLKKKRFPSMQQLDEHIELTTENTPELKIESKAFYVLLDALQEPGRAICSLFYVESFTVKEIAMQMNMQEGTVKWHLHQVRKKLKPVLEKYYG
jgi:RNA polymerase sigma-70 factor (ECF subfamily)